MSLTEHYEITNVLYLLLLTTHKYLAIRYQHYYLTSAELKMYQRYFVTTQCTKVCVLS